MTSSITLRPIEQIAVTRLGEDLFATGEFDTNVSVWSVAARSCVTRLATILDFGGERLAITSSRSPIVATGSWTRGINAYECSVGKRIWSRFQIRNVQQVCDLSEPSNPRLGVVTEGGFFRVLDGLTGETKLKIGYFERVFPSNFGDLYLGISGQHVQLASLNDAAPMWKRKLESFAVLHAAFSTNLVTYAEAAGSVHCCDFSGREVWKVVPASGEHVRSLAWNPESRKWLALSHRYESGSTEFQLFEIDESGDFRSTITVEAGSDAKFFSSGRYIVTAAGSVIYAISGSTVWRFW